MKDRRLLTYAADQGQAEKRRDSYRELFPTAEATQLPDGQWAVTAAKAAKKEGRA